MNREIIKKIIYFMKENKPFVLATILSHSGSTPRSKGAKMLISQNGLTFGTIGGGLLEAKVIQAVPKVIMENKIFIMKIDLSSDEVEGMGMICGGQVSVVFDPIFPKKTIKKIFELCLETLEIGQKCIFVTIYNKNERERFLTGKRPSYYLISDNGQLMGNCQDPMGRDERNLLHKINWKLSGFDVMELEDKIITSSLIDTPSKVYLVGAGHVAQPTEKIASIVGFKVVVMDDREEFANTKRFPNAHEIKIVDFYRVFKNIYVDEKAYIVIITRGHTYDQIVLEQALKTDASYIGMIGSSKKRDTIFKKLMLKGISNKSIRRVSSPIGIDIGSETAEEIGLSIVAEMVMVRAGGYRRETLKF